MATPTDTRPLLPAGRGWRYDVGRCVAAGLAPGRPAGPPPDDDPTDKNNGTPG